MYKKLEEETIDDILEAGIDEFIEKGLQGAVMSGIAKKSGVSVGVIYKYFTDKNSGWDLMIPAAVFMRYSGHMTAYGPTAIGYPHTCKQKRVMV